MKCPKCNTFNRKSSKFCRNCGSKFVICPKCGSDNIEDDATGYLQYTCGNCGHFWGHSGEECPKCGSDDTEDDNTGNLPYKCNVCGHNWGNDDIDEDEEDDEEDENIRPSSVPTKSTDEGPAWLGCLLMILGVVGGGFLLGLILDAMGML